MLRILSKIRTFEIFEQSKPKRQQFIIILKSDSDVKPVYKSKWT